MMVNFVLPKPKGYTLVIRDNTTGDAASYVMEGCEWFEHSLWFLTEGNFGCDCNRGLSFWRAKGVTEAEIHERDSDEPGEGDPRFSCGETRYTIIKAILEDGSEVLVDGQGYER